MAVNNSYEQGYTSDYMHKNLKQLTDIDAVVFLFCRRRLRRQCGRDVKVIIKLDTV